MEILDIGIEIMPEAVIEEFGAFVAADICDAGLFRATLVRKSPLNVLTKVSLE